MTNEGRFQSLMLPLRGTGALALTIIFVLTLVTARGANAQNYQVIHTFIGPDGANPVAGLTIDRGGKLYGTTYDGHGGTGWGGAFQMRQHGSSWIFASIHVFDGQPLDRVVFGPDGILYGTSPSNLVSYYYGYIFNLSPPTNVCEAVSCTYNSTVLYGFSGGSDGATPRYADLIFDDAGNIYGTTSAGGNGLGVVYELMNSVGGWTEQPLYAFSGPDGSTPYSGVIFDTAGNLYGTTTAGGSSGNGMVYELSPAVNGWTQQVIYSFQGANDGSFPVAGLIFDHAGNLYGATANGGADSGGTVFELTPSGNTWNYSLLYSFSGGANCGPWGTLTMDAAGNLYGTTTCDGANGYGNVFELTNSGGTWTYTSLYDFTSGNDGKKPYGQVIFDSAGNLYGTAFGGGANQLGVVWEITP